MLWEFIATVFAGFGAAGIALFIRSLSRKKSPRWLIPVFAGAGMLGFQIYSEYTWFDHQSSRLPEGVEVVRTVQETAPWRPWSFWYPQTLRFIAADIKNAAVNQRNPDLVIVNLYFFERRMTARMVPQVIHCTANARADFTETLQIPAPGEKLSNDWRPLTADDPLLTSVCAKAANN
jgi:hypothetical protein